MKLAFCANCHDVFKLTQAMRQCKCGNVSGRYRDDGLHADVSDNSDTFVLGFHNGTLRDALLAQLHQGDLEDGMGRRFTAFVIPNGAPTVHRTKADA